jgi:hypothetical protein
LCNWLYIKIYFSFPLWGRVKALPHEFLSESTMLFGNIAISTQELLEICDFTENQHTSRPFRSLKRTDLFLYWCIDSKIDTYFGDT